VGYDLRLKHRNATKISKQISLLLASSMTLYIIINILYVRDEIKRLGQKYADKMEEHANILGKQHAG